MSDFIVSLNIFDEFDNFEDWDAAQKKERGEKRWSGSEHADKARRRGLVRSAGTCKKKTSRFILY